MGRLPEQFKSRSPAKLQIPHFVRDDNSVRDVFIRDVFERMGRSVVMPERVHLLVSEPVRGLLADAIRYLNLMLGEEVKHFNHGGHGGSQRKSAEAPRLWGTVQVRCLESAEERAYDTAGGIRGLSRIDCLSCVSSNRTRAAVRLLQLPATGVPRSDIALARIFVLAAHHSGVCVDGQHEDAYRRH